MEGIDPVSGRSTWSCGVPRLIAAHGRFFMIKQLVTGREEDVFRAYGKPAG